MINGDENYEFDIEEGWTEPKKAESGAATEQKPNGGGQSLPPAAEAWPSPDPAMFHGLAGEVVATILPNTEADAVALLVNSSPISATSLAACHFSGLARRTTIRTFMACWSARLRRARGRPGIV